MFAGMVFVFRILTAWSAIIVPAAIVTGHNVSSREVLAVVFFALMMGALVVMGALSHLHRAHLVAGRLSGRVLSNRQRVQIEMPYDPAETFDMVEAAMRELPRVDELEADPSGASVQATVLRQRPVKTALYGLFSPLTWFAARHNLVRATVTAGDAGSTVTVISEPNGGVWNDWFLVDDASNYESVETLRRSLARRAANTRRREQESHRQTETEKELSEARLGLLSAQVEPHFLYNTLASAQVLVRSDPARADEMLGNLITYLRNSLPKTDEQMSNLGAELERTRAYLDILKVRMGSRLNVSIDVPAGAESVPMPGMMLQTLAENAIKHGLESKPGGGTIWLRARLLDGQLEVTVADDGRGLSTEGSGTGIGLKNVRERLRLIYGDRARLTIGNNFPAGVSATVVVPVGEST